MPAAVRLDTMRDGARARSDRTDTGFVSDSELNGYINKALLRIYRDLARTGGGRELYATSASFSTVASTESYSFATITGASDDILYVLGVDAQLTSDWRSLRPYTFTGRNRAATVSGWGLLDRPRYAVVGRQIRFIPAPSGVISCRLWYVPEPTALSADGDTITNNFGIDEFIELDAAIQVLAKEESDVSQLLVLRNEIRRQILTDARALDTGFPKQIQDIGRLDEDLWL